MRETHINGLDQYRSGSKWYECPRCGFDYRLEEMVTEYTGKFVCQKCVDLPKRATSQ